MKLKHLVSFLLLVVYAAFFASANLCYHTHQLANGEVIHSHIFWGGKNHNHTDGQLQIIDQLCHTAYQETESCLMQEVLPTYAACLEFAPIAVDLLRVSTHVFSLRAPPVF